MMKQTNFNTINITVTIETENDVVATLSTWRTLFLRVPKTLKLIRTTSLWEGHKIEADGNCITLLPQKGNCVFDACILTSPPLFDHSAYIRKHVLQIKTKKEIPNTYNRACRGYSIYNLYSIFFCETENHTIRFPPYLLILKKFQSNNRRSIARRSCVSRTTVARRIKMDYRRRKSFTCKTFSAST